MEKPTLDVWNDGTKTWNLNGLRHREDGPAVIYNDGAKEWWLNGKFHRVDGPAIEYLDGFKVWYLDGVEYNCVEWMLKVHELGLG